MMEDREIIAYLEAKRKQSINDADGEVSQRRQDINDYYMGELYGGEDENQSSVVTREVLETIEWCRPAVIKPFVMGHPASFKPIGRDDVDRAEIETKVVNHVLFDATDTFGKLADWFQDAIKNPNGYVKIWWDDTPRRVVVRYKGLLEDQLAVLNDSKESSVLETSEGEPFVTETELGPIEMPTFDVVVLEERLEPKIRWESVPAEEVLVDNEAESMCLDGINVCHHREVTRSELIAMGYNREDVMDLPEAGQLESSSERENRRDTTDEDWDTTDLGVMQKVEVYEWYCHIDVDEDDYAELRKVVYNGTVMLENDYCTMQPFCTLGSIPQAHRHIAISLAEVAMSSQRVSSEILRQTLDNLYRTNGPRGFIGPGVNKDQFMNYRRHGAVEVNGSVAENYAPEVVPSVIGNTLPMLEWLAEDLAGRTGVTQQSMGGDSEAMAQSTMGAYLESLGMASQRTEFLVRCFAETGISELIRKCHELLRTHQDVEMEEQIAGEWITIDPRTWIERRDLRVNVGIGVGTQKERLSSAMGMLETQREAMAAGLTTPSRLYNSLEDLCAAMGKPGAERYFLDPESDEAKAIQQRQAKEQQQQGDQMVQAMTAQMELQMADMASKQQQAMAKIQADMLKFHQENQRKWAELEFNAAKDVIGQGIEAANVVSMGGDD